MTTQKDRRLPFLPDYGTPLSAWRDWLTEALNPPKEFRIEDFVRHGRQRIDACELVVTAPGVRTAFQIDEQRFLSTPGTVRATLAGATDGMLRPETLSKPELEDVWVALVTLATVTASQDLKSEALDWVEQFEETAERIEGQTFQPQGQVDALIALVRGHARFDRQAALELCDRNTDPLTRPRPALVVDRDEPGVRWARVGEFACFLRHIIGTGSISTATIGGRLSALSITRIFFAQRALGTVLRADLYRLPPDEETT